MPYAWIPKKTKKKVKKQRKRIQSHVQSENKEIGGDIDDLQKKRERILAEAKRELAGKKGLAKVGAKLGYMNRLAQVNQQIKQRQQYLGTKFQVKGTKQRVELEKAREELEEIRKKKAIKQDDIFGTQDLFRI